MSDRELRLKARIALLEYYASLMQSYKVFILTFAVSILTVFELWFRIHKPEPLGFLFSLSLSFILGGILAGVGICTWRWFWCGHIVTSAIKVAEPIEFSMGGFDDRIKCYAYNSKNWPDFPKCWMCLMEQGDDKKLLVICWVMMFLFLGFVIFDLWLLMRLMAISSFQTIY